jgi:hypothetical protein
VDRNVRILVTAAVVGALVAPMMLDRDSFPLSTYPMYSRVRGQLVTLATAQAVDAEGTTSALTLHVIGDSDDPLVVAGELRAALRDGRAQQRCVEIADRAREWAGLPADVVAVEVVTERHDAVAQVRGESSLIDRTVQARCEIGSS